MKWPKTQKKISDDTVWSQLWWTSSDWRPDQHFSHPDPRASPAQQIKQKRLVLSWNRCPVWSKMVDVIRDPASWGHHGAAQQEFDVWSTTFIFYFSSVRSCAHRNTHTLYCTHSLFFFLFFFWALTPTSTLFFNPNSSPESKPNKIQSRRWYKITLFFFFYTDTLFSKTHIHVFMSLTHMGSRTACWRPPL